MQVTTTRNRTGLAAHYPESSGNSLVSGNADLLLRAVCSAIRGNTVERQFMGARAEVSNDDRLVESYFGYGYPVDYDGVAVRIGISAGRHCRDADAATRGRGDSRFAAGQAHQGARASKRAPSVNVTRA